MFFSDERCLEQQILKYIDICHSDPLRHCVIFEIKCNKNNASMFKCVLFRIKCFRCIFGIHHNLEVMPKNQ